MADRVHSLIVGGTRGIGREQVASLAAMDHIISVLGRRPPAADVELPQVHYWSVDLRDLDRLRITLAEIVEKNGKLNNLIFFQRYRGNGDDWAGEIETTLTATKTAIDSLIAEFDTSRECSIVVVGSMASEFIAPEQPLSYHVAKAGLIQIVRYYAVMLGPAGIRVNCVTPGAVLKEESKNFYLQHAALCELYQKITPLGRMATAQEIAQVISFLCSAGASFITGQNLVVDGGLSLAWHESLSRRIGAIET